MAAKAKEQISIPVTVNVPYRFAAGRHFTRFYHELRNNGKILAVKCPRCGRVQLPPRVVCAPCHVQNDEWVEVSDTGTLVSFTIMYIPLTDPTTGKPITPPLVYGAVQLDGCDSALSYLINAEPDFEKIWVGMRCKVVFRPQAERIGDLSDIRYIDPLPGQTKPSGPSAGSSTV